MAKVSRKFDIGILMAENLKLKVPAKQLNKGLSAPATDADKVQFFYSLMKKNLKESGLLSINTRARKNNADSKKIRETGNKLFMKGSKHIYEAMQLYNQAICCAEPDNGDELSIAYANRSAVLFEWKKYELCRKNIQLAKDARCPDRLIEKLNDRDLQCVAMMKDSANEKKKKDVSFYLSRGDPENPMLGMIEPFYSYDKYHSEPSLSLMPSSKVPFAVNCLEIENSPHGRHVVTTEDLKPGQILIIENPFVHTRLMKDDVYRYTKCANCYEENFLCLMPCSSCTNTMYCSEKCLLEYKDYHGIECPISDFMFQFGWTDLLSVRLTLKAYTIFESTEALKEFCKSFKDFDAQKSHLSFDENLTDEQKYRQIYGYTRKKFTTIEEYCKAAYFYQILMEKTTFCEMIKSDEDRNTLMAIIKRHMEIVNWNGITCNEYRTFDMSDAGDDKSVDIYSQGIYPFASSIQHSCAPNVSIISKGSKIIVYCSRAIKKGSQLLRSFKNCHYFQHHKSWRQKMLFEMFSFTCRCEACTNNYPSNYENIKKGQIPSPYDKVTGVRTSMLDYEVEKLDQFLEILDLFDSKLPCLSLNEIQLRVHKAMKLKYGELSTKLLMTFKFHRLHSLQ